MIQDLILLVGLQSQTSWNQFWRMKLGRKLLNIFVFGLIGDHADLCLRRGRPGVGHAAQAQPRTPARIAPPRPDPHRHRPAAARLQFWPGPRLALLQPRPRPADERPRQPARGVHFQDSERFYHLLPAGVRPRRPRPVDLRHQPALRPVLLHLHARGGPGHPPAARRPGRAAGAARGARGPRPPRPRGARPGGGPLRHLLRPDQQYRLLLDPPALRHRPHPGRPAQAHSFLCQPAGAFPGRRARPGRRRTGQPAPGPGIDGELPAGHLWLLRRLCLAGRPHVRHRLAAHAGRRRHQTYASCPYRPRRPCRPCRGYAGGERGRAGRCAGSQPLPAQGDRRRAIFRHCPQRLAHHPPRPAQLCPVPLAAFPHPADLHPALYDPWRRPGPDHGPDGQLPMPPAST